MINEFMSLARRWFLWLPNRCHTLYSLHTCIVHSCEQTAVLTGEEKNEPAVSCSKSKRHVRDIFTFTFSTDSKPKWRVLVLLMEGGIVEKFF